MFQSIIRYADIDSLEVFTHATSLSGLQEDVDAMVSAYGTRIKAIKLLGTHELAKPRDWESVAVLQAENERQEDMVRRHILWLVKYGFLQVVDSAILVEGP